MNWLVNFRGFGFLRVHFLKFYLFIFEQRWNLWARSVCTAATAYFRPQNGRNPLAGGCKLRSFPRPFYRVINRSEKFDVAPRISGEAFRTDLGRKRQRAPQCGGCAGAGKRGPQPEVRQRET